MTLQAEAGRVLGSLNIAGQLASRLHMPGTAHERSRVALALLRAAYDDAAAISVLLNDHGQELSGSALSLLRPMNDKFKRGTWFGFCATEEQVTEFRRKDRVPQRNLAADIEKHPPFDQYPLFSQQYQNAWSKFSSFTHGGSQIVGGYTMGKGIGAAFPEDHLIEVLKHVEGIAVTAVHVMCMIAGEYEPELATSVLDELVAAFHPPAQP